MEIDNVFVIATNCLVCKEEFKGSEILVAIGKPCHCLVHKRCYYIYPFEKGWLHPYPLTDYKSYTETIERKMFKEKKGNFLSLSK